MMGRPMSNRNEYQARLARFRGGKSSPLMVVPVRPGESGMLRQELDVELDPIPGRLLSQITLDVFSVFVSAEAIDALKDPTGSYPGMTEVVRAKMLTGAPLFDLEAEGDISKRLNINPASIGGVKKVNEAARLAYIAAVNHLARLVYAKAAQYTKTETAVLPAVYSQTVLQRLRGVLDPEDHVNGSVALTLPTMNLPVENLEVDTTSTSTASAHGEIDSSTNPATTGTSTTGNLQKLAARRTGGTQAAPQFAPIQAVFAGASAGNISTIDFYQAERMDRLVRAIGQMIEANPQYGEEMAMRWVHGLSVDPGKVPFVIARRTVALGKQIVGAMDTAGVTNETRRSDAGGKVSWSVPVPRTELGGMVVTIAMLKPDETLGTQPHPILSEPWGLDNFALDELKIDPVPVTMRQLNSDIASGSETTVAFYAGLHGLMRSYATYGPSRALNPLTVEDKSSIWQILVPASVTPQNVWYPADIDHGIFADTNAEVATCVISSAATFQTPIVFGPTPVETYSFVASRDIFGAEG